MKRDFMFTSESVTEGHPDKLCDQISDAIVDDFLQHDPYSKIITECAVSNAIVFISARFVSDAIVDLTKIARNVIESVGYDQPDFNAKTCSIITNIQEIPNHIAKVDEKTLSDEEIEEIPVHDQVTVFGFACKQTDALMPLPIWLAHQLAKRLTVVRISGLLPYLAPDGKTQVGVEYRDRRPSRIHSITIIASQNKLNAPAIQTQQLQAEIREAVIEPIFQNEFIRPDARTRIFIDADDPFAIGGPSTHAGLTGRKTAIDTYGEYARHSGAALSGKDPSRIDRIGAYAARYAAKNIVAASLAEECEVQLSYSVELSKPVSIQVETFGTGAISDDDLAMFLQQQIDFRLAGIIRHFNLRFLPSLRRGKFYQMLATYGQVGRTDLGTLPWETTDEVEGLLSKAGLC